MSNTDTTDLGRLKRNILLLAGAQALGGATPTVVIAMGGIVGAQLTADKSLATLPVSMMQLGLAAAALPMGWLAGRIGRQAVSLIGCVLGIIGGVMGGAAIYAGSFILFCLATLVLGFYFITVQQYRFAVADMAPPGYKARAISWVMLGGVAASVIGPQTAIWFRDILHPVEFAGAFVGQVLLVILAFFVLLGLRGADPHPVDETTLGPQRSTRELFTQPRLIAAIICGLVSYGLMSFVMTAAPLAMVQCGLPVSTAWLGIQWHVMAMYVPSFFTGHLIDRYGKTTVTVAGLVLLALSGIIAMMGLQTFHFWLSLVLLGVGWNFSFVGATALVTECYRPSERGKVQAFNDFAVFGTVAVASFGSGQMLAVNGWTAVNLIIFPSVAVALAALFIVRRKPDQIAQTPQT